MYGVLFTEVSTHRAALGSDAGWCCGAGGVGVWCAWCVWGAARPGRRGRGARRGRVWRAPGGAAPAAAPASRCGASRGRTGN